MNKLARWVPALAAPVVIVAAAVAIPAVASAQGPLPTKSPAQVLALVAHSDTAADSGTVEQSSDLGLPDLSALEQQSGAAGDSGDSLVDLLTASHTARVYTDGGTKQRVQVLDSLAERDVVRSGDSVWLYDSAQKQATHLALDGAAGSNDGAHAAAPALTPAQAAAQLVSELKPSTDFAVSSNERIAGRATYRLTLTPNTGETLVQRVAIAVDAKTGVPLEVSVYATGQSKPAATLAFSSIDYGTPAASDFTFTPPAGTKVETTTLGGARHPGATHAIPDGDRPTVVGSGWGSIVELPAALTQSATGSGADFGWAADGSATSGTSGTSGTSATSTSGADASTLLGLLQPVSGGRGLQTSLVSVLITTDGRVLAGAVPLTALESAAR
jgi:outer membrane lipoprotein-sorting protein